MAGSDTLRWTFGLINSGNKYLTAEQFQSKINFNGATLRKKQIWTLEKVGDNIIALKSCFGRFLGSDKDGKASGAYEAVGDESKWIIETQPDGKIALKNATFGRYFGGSGDQVSGFYKEPTPECFFTIHLAIHPQINLYNVNRKLYAHLHGEEVVVKEVIPWGADAMVILEFHKGRYAIRASNKKYVSRTGQLIEEPKDDALYTLVFKNDQVAFRDCKGKYLTAVGHAAVLQSRKDTISKDELFQLKDSQSQFFFRASNQKFVTIRDSFEVRAKQPEMTDDEIFQLEAVNRADMSGNVKWAIRGKNKKYWSTAATNVICDQESFNSDPSCQFEVEWLGSSIAFKASNGKYIAIKPNGQLAANSDQIEDNAKFVCEMINRPILILRCEFGFVGCKGGSGVLECNKNLYDVFDIVVKEGVYAIKAPSGSWVQLKDDDGFSSKGDSPTNFFFEMRAHSRMTLIAPNGKYVKGEQSGGFKAQATEITNQTLWEY